MEKKSDKTIKEELSCVILAAGEGTRMKPISLKVPKALSPIIDKPIIEHILDRYIELGISHFVMVVKSKDDPIKEYFNQNNIKGDLKFAYQTEALGSGHALHMAEDFIKSDSFFVTACDNMVSFSHLADMLQKFQSVAAEAVLSLQHEPIENLYARSNVGLEGSRVMKIIEKPTKDEILSDVMCLPIYLCRKNIFSYLKRLPKSARGEYELPQAFQMMIDEGKNIYGVFTESRFDLTVPEDLLEINFAFLKHQADGVITHSSLPGDLTVVPPVFINTGCTFGKNCSIGPYVIIGKNCTIGSGVKLRKCIILEGTEVSANLGIAYKVFLNI
jgi:bifunctional UDP-N-acetylglucosamine pyrophosphorylase/glucosamine-1-phosphate N-acetyltransferase